MNSVTPKAGKCLASAFQFFCPSLNLYFDLLRLREEAESAVIRVGELAVLAAELDSLPADESRSALGELSLDDLQLWKLIHRRNSKPLAIEFEEGAVNLPLPTLGAHIPENYVRTIRFHVQRPSKRQAMLTGIHEITETGTARDLPILVLAP